MAQQLVYTSAAKLLDAGRSGFGTVARSKSLSPLLVGAIERASQFSNIRGTERTRVIYSHRRIVAANNRIHLLSRISDAGADYTGRTSHIAHHVIVSQEEIARLAGRGITPADVLKQFPWLTRWDGSARFFGPEEDPILEQIVHPLGKASARSEWARLTGQPSHARLLAWDGAPRNGVLLVPRGHDTLVLLAEALTECGNQSWTRTFTTALESTDELSDFDWIVSSAENYREIESRCGSRTVYDLLYPGSLPLPPEPVAPAPEIAHVPTAAAPSAQPTLLTPTGIAPIGRIPVKVPSGSARQAYKAPVAASPKKNNKAIALGIVGAAAALVLAAVILWKTAVPSGGKTVTQAGTNESVPSTAQQAKDLLSQHGIDDETAEHFVGNTNSHHAEWAKYAVDLIESFASEKTIENLQGKLLSFSMPKDQRLPNIPWLKELHEAKNAVKLYKDDESIESNIKSITDCYNKLHSASNSYQNKIIDTKCFDVIHAMIMKNFFDLLLKEKGVVKDPIGIIAENVFDEKETNVINYNLLTEYVRSNFKELAKESLVPLSRRTLNMRDNDRENFKAAVACWADPKKDISPELRASFGKGFVPDKFEELLEAHRGNTKQAVAHLDNAKNNEKQTKTADTLILEGVPESEIILVTEEQIKDGVEVVMLKKWMIKDYDINMLSDQLKINGSEIKDLIKVDISNNNKEVYYSENWLDSDNANSIKIYSNGKFRPSLPHDKVVKLTLVSEENKFESILVTDENDKEASKGLIEGVTFEIKEISKDKVEIIISKNNLDQIFKNLNKFKLVVGNYTIESKAGDKKYYINNPTPANTQKFSISKHFINLIKNSAKDFDEKYDSYINTSRSKPENRKKSSLDLQDPFLNLMDNIKRAIGSSYICNELKREVTEKTIKEDYSKVKEILKDLKKQPLDDQSDDQNKLKDAEMKIGETKWDIVLNDIGINDDLIKYFKEYDKIKFSPEGLEKNDPKNKLAKLIKSLEDSNSKPKKKSNFINEFSNVKSVKVITHKGRLLIEALPK
jgi:hypothetical protein